MSDIHASMQGPTNEYAVLRDPAFRHYAADRALAMFLGRDVEIGFLRLSPQMVFMEDPGQAVDQLTSFNYSATPNLAEVTRVRVTPDAAIGLALTIVGQLAEAGLINREAFKSTLDRVLAESIKRSDIADTDG